jgi:hypothetical protein
LLGRVCDGLGLKLLRIISKHVPILERVITSEIE